MFPRQQKPCRPAAQRKRNVAFRPGIELLENRTVPTAGVLDTNFGTGGIVLTDFPPGTFGSPDDFARAVAIQPADGKLVVAGKSSGDTNYVALARYNTDGSPDGTFGGSGEVRDPVANLIDIRAIALQSNGQIVVAGSSSSATANFFLARYNADGSLDGSFGGTGTGHVITDFGASAEAFTVTVQADGKILAAGYRFEGANQNFALVRYTTD